MPRKKITRVWLDREEHALKATVEGESAIIVPLQKIKSILQVCWGDSFTGLDPESFCLFIAEDDSFLLLASYRDIVREDEDFGLTRPDLKKLELFLSAPPKQFCDVPPLTGALPAFWTVKNGCYSTALINDFIKSADVKEVTDFTSWG